MKVLLRIEISSATLNIELQYFVMEVTEVKLHYQRFGTFPTPVGGKHFEYLLDEGTGNNLGFDNPKTLHRSKR